MSTLRLLEKVVEIEQRDLVEATSTKHLARHCKCPILFQLNKFKIIKSTYSVQADPALMDAADVAMLELYYPVKETQRCLQELYA